MYMYICIYVCEYYVIEFLKHIYIHTHIYIDVHIYTQI